ncbi:hypothetical protein [Pleurocapsa sp. PCC 7319]|uniref:hypothetical protein n=1 Tax=Pleurocapsa sp. PCC 7319 TaxID=118161 RepID=UPI0003468CF7|nr:hypothetical protein [Pleurocapsa sp. PCC 7319]
MSVVICPGIHAPQLTEDFVQDIKNNTVDQNWLIFPTTKYRPYLAIDIYLWLKQNQLMPAESQPLHFIAFSAGVVGAIGAAWAWQFQGGKIASFVALDGWGMPLLGNFPIYRISHDYFTHWSSALLGAGKEGFYADPEVEHLDLWRSPSNCSGWRVNNSGLKTRDSLTNYLINIIDSSH